MTERAAPPADKRVVVAVIILGLVSASLVAAAIYNKVTYHYEPGPLVFPSNHVATDAQVRARSDAFGITNLQPTRPGGTIWTSRWGPSRSFEDADPWDPWFDTFHSRATYRAGGGLLWISGEVPRMYVRDPDLERQWRDVEITVYFKRVADANVPYAGMTAVARANHLKTEEGTDDLCDTRGYGARMRYDGHVDFEKETAHPSNEAVANRALWSGGLPKDKWIGYKFLVYDVGAAVHLELWRDLSGGKGGGDWQQVDSIVDTGSLFGGEPCKEGIDPRMQLTNSPHRLGSESGKPNVSVYFRSDGVFQDGLVYKWGSVREIIPSK